jgi:tRNA-dihydrouridine synthase
VIFGSGDIWTVDDIFRMHEFTGVHGVSVARGCIGNPWIFTQARALMRGETARLPTLAEQRHALESHFELAMQLHGEAAGGRRMRKFGIKFAAHHPQGDEVKRDYIEVDTVADWQRVLNKWYAPA